VVTEGQQTIFVLAFKLHPILKGERIGLCAVCCVCVCVCVLGGGGVISAYEHADGVSVLN